MLFLPIGIKIGPSCQEISEVSKVTLANPVVSSFVIQITERKEPTLESNARYLAGFDSKLIMTP